MERCDTSRDDWLMRVIVQPLVEEELQAFDRYNQIPGEYSDKTEKRIAGILRKYDTDVGHTGVWKVVKRGLLCAMVALLVAFCSCAAIPSLREKIVHAVLEWYEEYLVVYFTDTTTEKQLYRELGYIPDGFAAIQEDESGEFLTRIYANEQGEMFTFMREPSQSLSDTSASYADSEHQIPEDVLVGNNLGIFFQGMDGYENMLLWNREGYVYTLIGFFSCEELVTIAINIK